MHKTLADQLRGVRDVETKLIRLSVNKPQEELFNRVFGCGKLCPFCSAPCKAGGKDHTEHFVILNNSVHRPEGIGYYFWVDTKKLVPDICSSLVASEKTIPM